MEQQAVANAATAAANAEYASIGFVGLDLATCCSLKFEGIDVTPGHKPLIPGDELTLGWWRARRRRWFAML